jgi:hypothetical protein
LQRKKVVNTFPHIPKPEQIGFVKKQSFLAIITGFSQVAKPKEIRRYFGRGRDISGKHLEIFHHC